VYAREGSLVNFIKLLRAGVLYFAIVFGIGFLLGIVRVVVLVPRIGSRVAELAEVPVMIAASYLTARFLLRKLSIAFSVPDRFVMGISALFLMLAAEFGLVFWLRGASFAEYFSTRDPLTAGVYYVSLILFGLMPLVVKRSTP